MLVVGVWFFVIIGILLVVVLLLLLLLIVVSLVLFGGVRSVVCRGVTSILSGIGFAVILGGLRLLLRV